MRVLIIVADFLSIVKSFGRYCDIVRSSSSFSAIDDFIVILSVLYEYSPLEYSMVSF